MKNEKVTLKDVEHIMKLSRLEFSDEEKEAVKKNLNDIVDYFGILSEVNTAGVKAVNKEVGSLRPDEIKTSMAKEDVVRNAPFHTTSAFIVPRVVE